ncbi:MAG: histidine--tRNA ligase [Terriglobales bacterium]
MKLAAVKGMRDLLPADTRWFQQLEATVRSVFALYNFEEIRTPIVEPAALFQRAVGAETDIVGKEMYTFADRDGAELTLRPEATASAVRAYVEHRLWLQPGLTRLYYMGPMFRRERPQKGRYRQFYQVGAEVLGSAAEGAGDAWVDFELLAMLRLLLERCGISGWELVINSVGCALDRPAYHAALRAALAPQLPNLCGDCQRRAATNPLRVLDCKVPADQPIIELLPGIFDYLEDNCRRHFHELRQLLEAGGIAYRIDQRLVRGLDYYTSTAFEFVHGALGSQNALLGGGRYDGLAQALGAPAQVDSAIGFALGEDRFVLAMQAAGAAMAAEPTPQRQLAAVVLPLQPAQLAAGLALADRLRRQGVRLELAPPARKLGRSLELAAKLGAAAAVLVGEAELASQRYGLKWLATGEQTSLDEGALACALARAPQEPVP